MLETTAQIAFAAMWLAILVAVFQFYTVGRNTNGLLRVTVRVFLVVLVFLNLTLATEIQPFLHEGVHVEYTSDASAFLIHTTNSDLMGGLQSIKMDQRTLPFVRAPDGMEEFELNGIYSEWFKQIRIKKPVWKTWFHELAHHVWSHHITQTERDRYIRTVEDARFAVTAYAATNVKEDFAETFALWVLNSPRTYRAYDRVGQIEGIVRRITGCTAHDARSCVMTATRA